MPSRKSDSSETKAESRRTSLRRLGSIASLQTLNPFNRRRSNNTATDSPASTSNLSLSSTAANAPSSNKTPPSSQKSIGPETVPEVPALPGESQAAARKASYICLPDDPIGGMPRSRTFSNLPIPIRKKQTSNSLVQSKSHARLPSALLPSTRVPSPHPSSRKHSITRLTTIDSNITTRESLARSDTEPLLDFSFDQPSTRRSTAFKENIPSSPTRPTAFHERKDSGYYYPQSNVSSRAYHEKPSFSYSRHPSQANLGFGHGHGPTASASTLSLTKYAELPEGAYKRLSQKYDSSPIYRSSKERAPTPGQPVQRWNSQPLLSSQSVSNNANPPLQRSNRSSFGEIKQTRLMSTMPPPTPPPPKTPLGSDMLGQSQPRRSSAASGNARLSLDKTPMQAAVRPPHPATRIVAEANKPNPNGSIHIAKPSAYWTGRFSSLNDKYRNGDLMRALNLDSSNSPTTWTSKADTDKMYTPAATESRMRRAVKYLYDECATEDARQSFLKWQKQLTAVMDNPELGKPVGGSGKNCALQMSLSESDEYGGSGSTPLSTGRKISFMDRLLGKKAKILGASG
ncbi:Hypothetical predicted protein [Lecanosticta acicola]|uniref:Uncharacterized protein n=1 Tax=Lecanosticta acicola TaxID=111012 RepID=A0AAI8YSG9_9PEZI|nr:Hypothetical predicted protein [Lecanosticta acicola]